MDLIRPASGRNTLTLWLLLLLLGSLIFAYAAALKAMVGEWWSNNIYSYAFAIPAISLYLAWLRRDTLRGLQPAPSLAAGGLWLLAGLAMLVAGRIGSIVSLQELSLVVTIAGGVLFVLGRGFLKALWFPLAYLVFMIPGVWGVLLDDLHLPFQLLSAGVGISILQAMGIPAYRQGTFIELPHVTLEVAEVCSGVNYLIAVVAIGVPVAFVFLRGWGRRILLVGFSVAVALLSNGLRVSLIGALSYYGIITDLHGPFKVLQGIVVSIVGYAALFVGAWALSRTSHASPLPNPASRCLPGLLPRPVAAVPIFAVTLSVLLVLAGTYVHLYRPRPVAAKMDLNSFPTVIGPWRGIDLPRDDAPYRDLRPDAELYRDYRSPGEPPIRLYVAYYAAQEQGRELIHYRVKSLHTGASRIRLDLPAPHPSLEVNALLQPNGRTNTLVLFWYDLNGRIVAGRSLAKAHGVWQGLSRGISNGAVIIISSETAVPGDFGRAQSNVRSFVRQVYPILRQYLP